MSFNDELSKIGLPDDARAEIEGDLATIKSQLQKPKPSAVILREAGRSVRSITEGLIAGMLTPQAVAAVALLARTIGF